MRQPELGQTLVQLRKEKNLTQEELVDTCNVSIRTIQRIESGEVTPRTSTIKIILAALEEDISVLNSSTESLGDPVQLASARKWLNVAVFSGIVYFIMGFPETILEISRYEENVWPLIDFWRPSFFVITTYVAVKVLSFLSFGLFMFGFLKLGEVFGNALLKIAVYLMVSVAFILGFIDVISLLFDWDIEQSIPLFTVGVASTGGVGIVFGIGLIQLQRNMGNLALVSGIFELMIGGFFLIVILFFISLFLTIPATILEIALLYRAYEYIKEKSPA